MEEVSNKFDSSKITKNTWKANDTPKGSDSEEVDYSNNKVVVTPRDEGEELYDGDAIEVENILDEEYDILDNIDIYMENNITIEDVGAKLLESVEDITPIVGMEGAEEDIPAIAMEQIEKNTPVEWNGMEQIVELAHDEDANDEQENSAKNRSSPPEVFLLKGVLKICRKFTGEHPCRKVISIKLLCNLFAIYWNHTSA